MHFQLCLLLLKLPRKQEVSGESQRTEVMETDRAELELSLLSPKTQWITKWISKLVSIFYFIYLSLLYFFSLLMPHMKTLKLCFLNLGCQYLGNKF